MEKTNLKQKLRNYTAAGMIGLTSLFNTGCDTMNENRSAALGLRGMAMKSKTAEGAAWGNLFAGALEQQAQADDYANAAREGRSEVNVYVGNRGRNNQNTQNNVVRTPESSYCNITPDGIRHIVIPGLIYGDYINENKEMFPNGYFVRVYNAKDDHTYTVTHKDFVDLSK